MQLTPSPLAAVASHLNALGYSVLPIQPGTKYPGRWNGFSWGALAWREYEKRLATYAEIQEWTTWPGAGVGIALGQVSGVVALDFDNDINGLHARVQGLIPNPSPVKKIGSKGYTAFYRYNGEPSKKWKIRRADGSTDAVVELLSNGNQTVIPPTIHPGTHQPYYWIDGQGLESFRPDQLPALPSDFVDQVSRIFDPDFDKPAPLYSAEPAKSYDQPATMDDVASALEFISPDCSHDDWVHIGMAIKREFGEAGFLLWDSWSRKGRKYPKKSDTGTKTKWKSFQRPEGRTIGTLFYMAQQAGWQPVFQGPELPAITIRPGGNLAGGIPNEKQRAWTDWEEIKVVPNATVPGPTVASVSAVRDAKPTAPRELPKRIRQNTPMPDFLVDDAPGIIGKIARWITATSVRPQPVLSLAAAVSAAGCLFAHRVQTETRLRSNMLVISLAPSGAGKDHPQKCVSELFQAVGLGDNIGGSNVTSGNALVNRLYQASGRGLFIFDEFGRSLKNMTGAKASTFQLEIVTTIMQLYSSANTTFRGKEFSGSSDKNPRQDIEQPCLNVLGSTVPQHFYQALTSTAAVDGFLSRWLIFETFIRRPAPSDGADIIPPSELVAACQRINDMPTSDMQGNLSSLSVNIRPRIIPFSNEARDIIHAFRDYCDRQGDIEFEKKSGLDALWTRGAENAMKLALCGHDGDVIEADVARWACQMIEYMMHRNVDFLKDNLADNDTQAEVNRVLAIIRDFGDWMPKTKLTQDTQWLKKQRRDEIISTLVNETGEVLVRELESSGGRKRYEFKYNEE